MRQLGHWQGIAQQRAVGVGNAPQPSAAADTQQRAAVRQRLSAAPVRCDRRAAAPTHLGITSLFQFLLKFSFSNLPRHGSLPFSQKVSQMLQIDPFFDTFD
jgi:hypothetical protein